MMGQNTVFQLIFHIHREIFNGFRHIMNHLCPNHNMTKKLPFVGRKER